LNRINASVRGQRLRRTGTLMANIPAASASRTTILMTTQRMHRLSLQRGFYFYTSLFKNPPWLIMLDLFVSSLTEIPANTVSLKVSNKLSDEELGTAIGQLVEAGMVQVCEDDLFELTPSGKKQMDGFIREILASRESGG
jgi:hypothetical protein